MDRVVSAKHLWIHFTIPCVCVRSLEGLIVRGGIEADQIDVARRFENYGLDHGRMDSNRRDAASDNFKAVDSGGWLSLRQGIRNQRSASRP